jgi:hypothetical protein
MKKIILTLITIIGISSFTKAQNNEAKSVAVARAAANKECHIQGANSQYSVQEDFICNNIFSNFGNMHRTITFYDKPNCPPNQPCVQVLYPAAIVRVDCDFNVTAVVCGTTLPGK